MSFRKAELLQECKNKGVILDPNTKYTNKQLIHRLGEKSLEFGLRKETWALRERINLNEPMVCQWFKKLKKEQQNVMWEDNNKWVAERKENGLRCVVTYHPDYGFQFFSRHNSEKDYLPVEFDNILLQEAVGFKTGDEYKNIIKFPFIIDTEVITTNKTLDTSILPRNLKKGNIFGDAGIKSFQISSELNAACAIVQYNQSDSFLLQQQNPLVFQVFDMIMVNGHYLYNTPLKTRLGYLAELIKLLPPCFRKCYYTNVDKRDYYETLLENGAEGIVLKSLDSPYNNAGTRHADKWVKLKRSMSGSLGKDIDAFVTGFTPGNGRNEGLVGSIELSVYLRDKNGLMREHIIANISGFSDAFRKTITDTTSGVPKLHEALYGKVFAINGHTVSSVNLRFNHAVLVSEIPRMDKNAYQCDLEEEVLRANIL